MKAVKGVSGVKAAKVGNSKILTHEDAVNPFRNVLSPQRAEPKKKVAGTPGQRDMINRLSVKKPPVTREEKRATAAALETPVKSMLKSTEKTRIAAKSTEKIRRGTAVRKAKVPGADLPLQDSAKKSASINFGANPYINKDNKD